MALPSTYHLHHSLPNRSPTQRPRSLSLSEYQPLSFDRDALESAYQASLGLPSSHASSLTGHSSNFGGASTETYDSSISSSLPHTTTTMSTSPLNPTQSKLDIDGYGFPRPPSIPSDGYAGVGAGHTLTPPQSPLHKAAQYKNQTTLLSPVPASPRPPTPPPRPTEAYSAAAGNSQSPLPNRPGEASISVQPRLPPRRKPEAPELIMRRSQSDIGHDHSAPWGGGYEWIQGDGHGRGQRRALPAIPTNIPAPEPPQWEPDYKPQIPSELTAPSAQNAYASLSAPPPNLPPRKQRPNYAGQPSSRFDTSSSNEPGPGPSSSRIQPGMGSIVPSGSRTGPGMTASMSQSSLPPGAPDLPPQSPTGGPPSTSSSLSLPKREAEKEVFLRATDKTPIWSTHYLDPSLRQSLVHIPQQVANITNMALSGLSSGAKEKHNGTNGSSVEGLARAAKDWAISPDGRFLSEHGGQELGIGVINSGGDGWGMDKGRKKARVEVISRSGGIKVDVVELSPDRQIDLRIETKTGDILVLLPDTFHGPIQITSPSRPPEFLSVVQPNLKPIAKPYASLYTTFLASSSTTQNAGQSTASGYDQVNGGGYGLSERSNETVDMRQGGGGSWGRHGPADQGVVGNLNQVGTRGEHSKISIRSEKGRVVIGLRESKDEYDAKGMGLNVGIMEGGRKGKKKWWRA